VRRQGRCSTEEETVKLGIKSESLAPERHRECQECMRELNTEGERSRLGSWQTSQVRRHDVWEYTEGTRDSGIKVTSSSGTPK